MMANLRGTAVLSTFDVHEDAADFLSDLLESSVAPAHEVKSLVDASLLANSDDFHHLVSCATAIQQSEFRDPSSLEGNDVLTFICHILSGRECASNTQQAPWAETDRLIALAKDLADDAPYIRGPRLTSGQTDAIAVGRKHKRPRSVINDSKSHYWSEEKDAAAEEVQDGFNNDLGADLGADFGRRSQRLLRAGRPGGDLSLNIVHQSPATSQHVARTAKSALDGQRCHSGCRSGCTPSSSAKLVSARARRPTSSPFFPAVISSEKPLKRKRGGVVSSVPFPSLYCSRFGLIQEEMAHDPFWLLIAVTFLIKTNGRAAIPVFRKVRERFPSPRQLADPGNAEELLGMIRHLGLATNRLKFIQKYASLFQEAPPMAGSLHQVRNYDKRDDASGSEDMHVIGLQPQDQTLDALPMADSPVGKASMEAWEIGHMTQGKYTLDSWRIFCRDKLLGRAEDWNGKGREPEFQPEWMRVMPQDKELRAYLRWMWMREGWEWDPVTGERRVLRPELQLAVNEHRVEYDDQGGLRILDVATRPLDFGESDAAGVVIV
ncbi:hypothetical protein E4U53_000190 [Claviceps sorghi]|nr:hypothetical protein E4U53_000190 [Claviceps sorghi]